MVRSNRFLRIESLETRKLLTGVGETVEPIRACRSELVAEAESTLKFEAKRVEGVRSAEVRLLYDANALTIEHEDIQAGAAWASKASVVTKIDQAAGVVDVFVFSIDPVVVDGGILEMDFGQRGLEEADVLQRIHLDKLELNEGSIPVSPRIVNADTRVSPELKLDNGSQPTDVGVMPWHALKPFGPQLP